MKESSLPIRIFSSPENVSLGFVRTRFPVMTVLTALAAILLFRFDGGAFLQYDRAAIAAGEYWRLIGCHLGHWSADHLVWCLAVLVPAGVLAETSDRPGYLATLAASAVMIPLSTWFLLPVMHFYRGLSGICAAVFVHAAVRSARARYAAGERGKGHFFVCLCLFFLGKLAFESLTGRALFVETAGLFTPVPLVHLVGGTIGAAIAALSRGGVERT